MILRVSALAHKPQVYPTGICVEAVDIGHRALETPTASSLTEHRHEPEPLDLITEEACPDCDYREMCADRLSTEVQR